MSDIKFSLPQQQIIDLPINSKVYLHGQAGSGKTTVAVERMHQLIQAGVSAESILILVPQRSLAEPYRESIKTSSFFAGSEPSIVTIGGLAQRMITLFWPLIAKESGFKNPQLPPKFLTLETAQYFLADLVEPLHQKGYFENVVIDPNRLYSQILDNLNKTAVVDFPPEEISMRLIQAWAGKPSQLIIYQQAQECALLFRQYCLDQNLLDFSLQLSIFHKQLWHANLCKAFLKSTYRHLIYDNAEEDYPVAHDIVKAWLPELESVLVITDDLGGFRSFMGADHLSAHELGKTCDETIELYNSFVKSKTMDMLDNTLSESILQRKIENIDLVTQNAFSIESFRFYPQVLDWITSKVSELIREKNVPAEEIVILTPFLSDALRFSIENRFSIAGLKIHTFRPSRGLRDEPPVKALITLVKLAFPGLGLKPTRDEIRTTMAMIIEDCDYIRADLISQILFDQKSGRLRSFEPVKKEMQQRLTYSVGERFETLRAWLENNTDDQFLPLDIFISRLFGECLSQNGFNFHHNFDAASAIARLAESARKFRQILGTDTQIDWPSLNKDYIQLVESGILSAQYQSDWTRSSQIGAVLVSPAFSFLMSNHPVRFQFWLDIGSQGWWTRLDQPLTHPYVLNRNWQPGKIWSDQHEHEANQQSLARVTSGLIKRCREHIFMCTLGVNEQGNEERGALIMAMQTILRKINTNAGGKNV